MPGGGGSLVVSNVFDGNWVNSCSLADEEPSEEGYEIIMLSTSGTAANSRRFLCTDSARQIPVTEDPEHVKLEVRLWIATGERCSFEAFEEQALIIMREHGATILSIVKRDIGDGETPDEIHVIEFPSDDAYQAYRADERMKALASLREKGVSRTEVCPLPLFLV